MRDVFVIVSDHVDLRTSDARRDAYAVKAGLGERVVTGHGRSERNLRVKPLQERRL
jgi:hypothetical protein